MGVLVTKERPIVWIGGWASDLQCWADSLDVAFAGFQPRFVSAHVVLQGGARLEDLLAGSPEGTVLAGWSLGSLLVERLLREGRVPVGMPVVRVCPFLDFCDPTGPWKPVVLRRMIRRTFGEAQGVLEDFADLAAIPDGPLRRTWANHAIALGEENLADGLTVLSELRFDAPWADAPGGFLVSPDDRVSPPTATPPERTRILPQGSGHVPFLTHPEAFSRGLRELLET